MSIATEITRLQTAKTDLKTAIEAKGVTVPSSAKIDTYDDYVSQISTGGGTPEKFASWTYDNWGKPTNIIVKNGVISIPSYFQTRNTVLTSCTTPSSVTFFDTNAFSFLGTTSSPFDISNIDLNATKTVSSNNTNLNSAFYYSYIKGSMTISKQFLTKAASGMTSPCISMFSGAMVPQNCELTINVYADGVVIPRTMFQFSNSTATNKGKIDIIVHGTPSFLSRQSFRVISGTNVAAQSVTFADCTTPPNAESYTNNSNSPFQSLTGTIYVPQAGLSAWQTKYSAFADKIKAIGT